MRRIFFSLCLAAVSASPSDELKDLSVRAGAPLVIAKQGIEPAPAPLRDSLTLEQAVRMAAENNPDIQAALQELLAAKAERRGGRLPPNPRLEAGLRYGDGPRRADFAATADITDLLFYPLKWNLSGSAYRRGQMRAAAFIRDRVSEVKAAYYRLQALEGIHALQVSMLENAEASAELSQRQKAAGNIGLLQQAAPEEMRQDATLALSATESELFAAKAELSRLLGAGTRGIPVIPKASLPAIPDRDPSAEDLIRIALQSNPELAAAREDFAFSDRASAFAAWNRVPSVRAGIGLELEGSQSFLGPKVDLEIPLDLGWNAAAKARAGKEAARHRLSSMEDRIAAQVGTEAMRLAAARKTVRYYEEQVVPLREKVLAETQKHYNFMLLGVYDIIQAKQGEYAARRGHIEAQRSYWLAHAELERLLGAPWPEAKAAGTPDIKGSAR